MRGMHLERIEPQPLGTLRRRHEGRADAREACRIKRLRQHLAVSLRNGRRCGSEPAAFRKGYLLSAFPWNMAGGFAPRMGELHRHGDLRIFADRREHGPQRFLRSIVVKA